MSPRSRATRGPQPLCFERVMTEIEKAYIAGLFDGEGTAGIFSYKATKNGKRYLRVAARIANTDRRCLDYVKECYGGGNVFLANRGGKPNRKVDCYSFQVQNANAIDFLKQIQPYLRIKCNVVQLILGQKHTGPAPDDFIFRQPDKLALNLLTIQ